MWSKRVAYDEGAKIGRNVSDPWINEADLKREIRRRLGTQFKPRKTQIEAVAELLATFAVFAVVLAVALAVLAFKEPTIQPGSEGGVLRVFVDLLGGVGVVPAAVIAGVVAVLTVILASICGRSARKARRSARQELATLAYTGAAEAINRRRARERGRGTSQFTSTQTAITPGDDSYPSPHPRPAPATGQVSPHEAEELVAAWMRHLGEVTASATPFSNDGGIDVEGRFYIAQVKHYNKPVSVSAVREFVGVVAMDQAARSGLFFTSTGYVPGAVLAADQAGVALFVYEAYRGELRAANAVANTVLTTGLV